MTFVDTVLLVILSKALFAVAMPSKLEIQEKRDLTSLGARKLWPGSCLMVFVLLKSRLCV